MRTARAAAAATLTSTLLGSGLALVSAPALATAPVVTCQGKPATVVGTTGTEGDDVMVVLPAEGVTAQALGGNDLICIDAAPLDGIRTVTVDAGPGNDSVVNESTDVDDVWYTTVLGTGSDSYVGLDAEIPDTPQASPFLETVHAGARDLTQAGLELSQDTDADTIDTRGGDDVVLSGSSAAGSPTNNDTVVTGTGDDTVEWAGEQGTGTVDLGTGENALEVHPGWKGSAVVVDAPSRTATADGRTVLRWAGDVVRYDLRLDNRSQSFVGSDADEVLVMAQPPGRTTAAPSVERSVAMGRGDDSLLLYSMGSGTVDGGPGRDTWSGSSCATAVVRVGGTFSCTSSDGPSVSRSFGFDRFEDLLLRGGDVTVVGSDRAEKVKVVASIRIRVRGRGGDDVVNANTSGRLARPLPVVLSGGRGADRLVGSPSPDRMLGGSGQDTLFGDSGNDELRGGAGRDKVVGQAGRDRCTAEVRRSCERR